mmetsp:Transcript_38291/g.121956  ORF Transcript_38291/g.121956 Transcript_38291/m.121956 type:complete len:154 (+) Transcript_38291:3716-4177(+)
MDGEQQALQGCPRVGTLLGLPILLGKLLRLFEHSLDLRCRQATSFLGDHQGLFGTAALVLRTNAEDAACINLKGDLDLRRAPRRRPDASEPELAQEVVALREQPLALEDLDVQGWLVVAVRGEDHGILRRQGGIPGDHLGHHTAHRLDAKGQR